MEGFLRYRFGDLYLEGLMFGILRYLRTVDVYAISEYKV